MSTNILSAGYRNAKNLPPHPQMPSIQPGEPIPHDLQSPLATNESVTGYGPIHAVIEVLSGGVQAIRDQDSNMLVAFLSSGKQQQMRTASSWLDPNNPNRYMWKNVSGRSSPYVMGLIHYIVHGRPAATQPTPQDMFSDLTQHIRGTLGISLPTRDPADWDALNHDTNTRNSIITLSDHLYYSLKQDLQSGSIIMDDSLPDVPTGRPLAESNLSMGPALTKRPASRTNTQNTKNGVSLEPLARLVRLTKSGGAALIQGPTGAFKTETGKKVALDTGARLITLKGAAGIEDRDFIGSITPTEHGPKWVDGPLAQAFRHARKHKTVLLVDELLRFEPLYANVLIGALDTVNEAELNAMGIKPTGTGTHYLVTLPNGEAIAAPKENLTIIATTNQGEDYEQFQNIDAALLGRFELQLDMSEPDPKVLTSIYKSILKDPPLIKKVLTYEKWTRQNTGVYGGLLKRAANPRVVINFLKEAARLIDENLDTKEALLAAFEVTLQPYCAPRDTHGMLAEDACAVMLHEFKKTVIA